MKPVLLVLVFMVPLLVISSFSYAETDAVVDKQKADHAALGADFAATKAKAEAGDPEAQYLLGWLFRYGKKEGIFMDYEQAVYWYRKAADQGHAAAQNALGWMYKSGKGVSVDKKQAAYWFRKAAVQGHAVAQYGLGSIYGEKRLVGAAIAIEDREQAIYWYRKAADQGLARAQVELGGIYDLSYPKDEEQAVYWYRKAAAQGDAKAQKMLRLLGVDLKD